MVDFRTAFSNLMILEEYNTVGQPPWGIDQSTYSGWAKKAGLTDKKVMTLSREEGMLFAYDVFWTPLKCSSIPDKIDFITFEFGYNASQREAILYLQRSLGVTDDGIIGPATLSALKKENIIPLAKIYLTYQNKYYQLIENPTNEEFENGWHKRIDRTAKILGITL